MVVSAVDQEQLARKIRVVHIHRLGGFTPVDGVLIWIIHSLVATAIILFLVQTNVLPMDWDLRPFFHEQRVVSSQVVEGGFFFAFAPMCVLTGDSSSPMCLGHLGDPLLASLLSTHSLAWSFSAVTWSGVVLGSHVLVRKSAICHYSVPHGRHSSQSHLFTTPGTLPYPSWARDEKYLHTCII